MSDQAPAYQMYAADWIKSRRVRLMNDAQRGWYIQLLNDAWVGSPQCMLPNNREALQDLAGISQLSRDQPDFNERWIAVESMFTAEGDHVYNERQMKEFTSQKLRSVSASKAGNASAKRREIKRKELQEIKREHLATGNGSSTDVQREANGNPTLHTSSSTPTSSLTISPISPQGGGQVSGKSPKKRKKASKDMTAGELKKLRVKENTNAMKYIGDLFGRGEDTLWNQYEAKALDDLGELVDGEVNLIGRYYRANMGHVDDIRRRNVETLLNNWMGELDRAALWERNQKPHNTRINKI